MEKNICLAGCRDHTWDSCYSTAVKSAEPNRLPIHGRGYQALGPGIRGGTFHAVCLITRWYLLLFMTEKASNSSSCPAMTLPSAAKTLSSHTLTDNRGHIRCWTRTRSSNFPPGRLRSCCPCDVQKVNKAGVRALSVDNAAQCIYTIRVPVNKQVHSPPHL